MAQSDWECFYPSRVRDPSPLHAYLWQFTDAYYIKKNYNKGHTFNRSFYWNGSGDSRSYGFFDGDVAFQSSVQVLWYPPGIDPKPVGL